MTLQRTGLQAYFLAVLIVPALAHGAARHAPAPLVSPLYAQELRKLQQGSRMLLKNALNDIDYVRNKQGEAITTDDEVANETKKATEALQNDIAKLETAYAKLHTDNPAALAPSPTLLTVAEVAQLEESIREYSQNYPTLKKYEIGQQRIVATFKKELDAWRATWGSSTPSKEVIAKKQEATLKSFDEQRKKLDAAPYFTDLEKRSPLLFNIIEQIWGKERNDIEIYAARPALNLDATLSRETTPTLLGQKTSGIVKDIGRVVSPMLVDSSKGTPPWLLELFGWHTSSLIQPSNAMNTAHIISSQVSADGSVIAVTLHESINWSTRRTVTRLFLRNEHGTYIEHFESPPGTSHFAANLSDDGLVLALISENGILRLFVRNAQSVYTEAFESPPATTSSGQLAISRNGSVIVTTSNDGVARLFMLGKDGTTYTNRFESPAGARFSFPRISSDGFTLALTAQDTRTIVFVRNADGTALTERFASPDYPTFVRSTVFSRDFSALAIVLSDGTVALFARNARDTYTNVLSLPSTHDSLKIVFSDNGSIMAIATGKDSLRIFARNADSTSTEVFALPPDVATKNMYIKTDGTLISSDGSIVATGGMNLHKTVEGSDLKIVIRGQDGTFSLSHSMSYGKNLSFLAICENRLLVTEAINGIRVWTPSIDTALYTMLTPGQLELIHDVYKAYKNLPLPVTLQFNVQQSSTWWQLPALVRARFKSIIEHVKIRAMPYPEKIAFAKTVDELLNHYKNSVTNIKLAGIALMGKDAAVLKTKLVTFFKICNLIIKDPYADVKTMQQNLRRLYATLKEQRVNTERFGILNRSAQQAWLSFEKEFLTVVAKKKE